MISVAAVPVEPAMLVEQTLGAAARIHAWRAAGMPGPDMERLAFRGADSVREVVIATLRKIPTPVAWFAVEGIQWIECGRHAMAWTAPTLPSRALCGDIGQDILINGNLHDSVLPSAIAHEVAHALHRAILRCEPEETCSPLGELDMLAVQLLPLVEAAPARLPDVREIYIARRIASERLADRQAEAWGFSAHYVETDDDLRRWFGREFDRATDLAAKAAAMPEAEP